MWRRAPATAATRAPEREAPPTPEQQLWLAALRHLAGSARGVVYDVPLRERPHRRPGRIALRGSAPWERYLDSRERLDSGELTLVVSLRPLDDDEAAIAIDWGTTYANTFLLVEPGDPRCDLTAPDNRCAVRVRAATIHTLRTAPPPEEQSAEWLDGTPLVTLLRQIFGTWVHWDAPLPSGAVERTPLDLSRSGETFGGALIAELHARFPQDAFDRELVRLQFHERELLWGPVSRSRSVFRTRLGLPVLLDTFAPDRAVRQLANRGRITVVDPDRPRALPFGLGHPVPVDLPDEQFARFVVA
jgi:hypothetical protein